MKKIKMESKNKYLGDDKFKKFLEHYGCPTDLNVIKLKFAGALCSPNMNLRPTDVISSFWPEGRSPRLETKEEADLFFKIFMGLWDDIFELIKANKLKLLPVYSTSVKGNEFIELCQLRYNEIEYGFVEGFWGGLEDLKLPAYLAELADSLSQMAEVYITLAKKIEQNPDNNDVFKHFKATDEMVEKALALFGD